MLLLAALFQSAAPAPAPLMVFFDSGKTEIRRDWESVLDQAAREGAGARLTLVGHTDRPGSAAGNRAFSRRRAAAVADALVARGVPRAAIRIEGEGEDNPFIPTADGVMEIQNRRVDIRIER